jgi:hypothetical protein
MGEIIATIILAMIGVIAAYNILNNGGAASGLIKTTGTGAGQVIAALQGR